MVTVIVLLVLTTFQICVGCSITKIEPNSFPENVQFDGFVTGTFTGSSFEVGLRDLNSNVLTKLGATLKADGTGLSFTASGLTGNRFLGVEVFENGIPVLSCELTGKTVFVHAPITISSFQGVDGLLSPSDRFNVAGRQKLKITGNNFFVTEDEDVLLKVSTISGHVVYSSGRVVATSSGLRLDVETPAIPTPLDWTVGCQDPTNPVRSATCVPDIDATIAISLDKGASFSSTESITFGFVKPLKVAILLPATIDDKGWSAQVNEGRILLEDRFGALIDATTYFENVVEGEFEPLQNAKGATFANGVSVPENVVDGDVVRVNTYYPALKIMKDLCDQDYDLVISASFGFQTQTFDISNDYVGCQKVGDGQNSNALVHTTHFLSTGGVKRNDRMSTGFGKIYQTRYLTGMVAGNELAKQRSVLNAAGDNNATKLCVGYIAAFPIPEVQRGINAFAIGCKEVFSDCLVKVAWSGTFHNSDVERDMAAFFYNEEGCRIVTQHSDTAEPQIYFAGKQNGATIGYHSDARKTIGDSVLISSMMSWAPIFSKFVEKLLTNTWTSGEDAWLGFDDEAVRLAPFFSPYVDQAFAQLVRQKEFELRSAKGEDAFHEIFCGPTNIRKRWVYEKLADGNATMGCGFQPLWKRLGVPDPVDPRSFWDASKNPLSVSDPITNDSCLSPSALLSSAYQPINGVVMSDFLVDGVELLMPRTTPYGTIYDESSHECQTSYGTTGDRFFAQAPDYPVCDGTQWTYRRSDSCDPNTEKSSIVYDWIVNETTKTRLLCGNEEDLTVAGKLSFYAPLPFVKDGPPCDHVPFGSTTSSVIIAFVLGGVAFLTAIAIALVNFRKHDKVRATQPVLVLLMAFGGIFLNLSTLAFLGEPSNVSCVLRIWTFNIGFDLVFAFLWAKIYRVHILFKSVYKLKRVTISDHDMIKLAAFLVAIDVFILILWTGIDMPKPLVSKEIQFKLPAPGIGTITYTECGGDSNVFMAATLMYKVLLVLSACFLVFASKNIPKTYVEHKFIIFSAYNTAIFSGVVLLLTFQNSDNPSVALLIQGAGVCIGSGIIVGSLAIPRILVAIGAINMPSSTHESTGTGSGIRTTPTEEEGDTFNDQSYVASYIDETNHNNKV